MSMLHGEGSPMRRKFQPADQVQRQPEHERTQPASVPSGATGTVIEVERWPALGPSYRVRVAYEGSPDPAWEQSAFFDLVKAAPSRAVADLRSELTAARRDITEAANDPELPTAELLRLRWRACKLAGQLELAEEAAMPERS